MGGGADLAKDRGPHHLGAQSQNICYPPTSSLEIGPLSKFQPGAPSNLNPPLHKWHEKDDIQNLDKKCVLLLFNSQENQFQCAVKQDFTNYLAITSSPPYSMNINIIIFNRISLVNVVVVDICVASLQNSSLVGNFWFAFYCYIL